MTQKTYNAAALADAAEDQLWTAFWAAEARHALAGVHYYQMWRKHVSTGCSSPETRVTWRQAEDVWRETRKRMDEAYSAWTRVAYPLHNIPFNEDEMSS